MAAASMPATCVDACSFDAPCVEACSIEAALPPTGVSLYDVGGTLGLLMLSGLFSGLTLGLMSLDIRQLEVAIAGAGAEQRRQAERILPLRKRGNLLLCTLLLANTLVNSGIAILTASFTGGVAGGILSTAFILIFGEVIPQSVCSRYGLAAGAKTADIVRLFVFLLYPIAWPLSLLLDRLLGEELGEIYTRTELKELFAMQARRARAESKERTSGGGDGGSGGGGSRAARDGSDGGGGDGSGRLSAETSAIREQEATFMCGVLNLSERTAEMIMTKLPDVFALYTDERLDFPLMSRIYLSGYTRIPIFHRQPHTGAAPPGRACRAPSSAAAAARGPPPAATPSAGYAGPPASAHTPQAHHQHPAGGRGATRLPPPRRPLRRRRLHRRSRLLRRAEQHCRQQPQLPLPPPQSPPLSPPRSPPPQAAPVPATSTTRLGGGGGADDPAVAAAVGGSSAAAAAAAADHGGGAVPATPPLLSRSQLPSPGSRRCSRRSRRRTSRGCSRQGPDPC